MTQHIEVDIDDDTYRALRAIMERYLCSMEQAIRIAVTLGVGIEYPYAKMARHECELIDTENGKQAWDMTLTCTHATCGYSLSADG